MPSTCNARVGHWIALDSRLRAGALDRADAEVVAEHELPFTIEKA